jgi:hypothetical protein
VSRKTPGQRVIEGIIEDNSSPPTRASLQDASIRGAALATDGGRTLSAILGA